MPGVLVARSEREDDKTNNYKRRLEGALCKLRNLSCRPDQMSVEFRIIRFKSGLLKRRMKSLFHE